jgi:hypothetical protein
MPQIGQCREAALAQRGGEGYPCGVRTWKRVLGLIWALCLLSSAVIGLVVDTDAGLALAVTCRGLAGLLTAVWGKPPVAVGFADRLLLRLPDPVFRALFACAGLSIAGWGLWAFFRELH